MGPAVRVIVPFIPGMLQEATVLALEQDRQEPEYWDVSSSEYAYFDVLKEVWAAGETFVIVEQDMVPYPTCIERMTDCTSVWCANDYLTCGFFQYGFGCTKFDAELINRFPQIWKRMETGIDFRSAHGDPRHYQHLDAQLSCIMGICYNQASPHRHRPPITHLNREHFYPGGVRP